MLQNLISLKRSVRIERGQDMAEYSLMIGLITVVIIAAAILLGPAINGLFNFISGSLGNMIGS